LNILTAALQVRERVEMAVLIENRQSKIKIPLKKLKAEAQTILDALACPDGELSLLIVDDSQIAGLNQEYLNRLGPTNVIAFPMREGEFAEVSPTLLGDVVISAETARQEGDASGIGWEERFSQLLVHGILHLLGYDHEKTKREALRMEKKSKELLSLIGDH
jgi:probable rRNA maturation factor